MNRENELGPVKAADNAPNWDTEADAVKTCRAKSQESIPAMSTIFFLMAQYGMVIIPLERVCSDYFRHLTPEKLKMKVATGDIDLILVPIEKSQKAARGVHVNDLAAYLDAQHKKAKVEQDKLMGRAIRRDT